MKITQTSPLILESTEEELKTQLRGFFASLNWGDLILLQADLGMGKTSLVRAFVQSRLQEQNLKDILFSSPSYNLIQDYRLPQGTIYHIDLYRLESEDQIESVGLWEALENSHSISFIEWPERIDVKDLPRRRTFEIRIEPITSKSSGADLASASSARRYVIVGF